jgi:hypothetical protein
MKFRKRTLLDERRPCSGLPSCTFAPPLSFVAVGLEVPGVRVSTRQIAGRGRRISLPERESRCRVARKPLAFLDHKWVEGELLEELHWAFRPIGF